jgi:hypothetical protein
MAFILFQKITLLFYIVLKNNSNKFRDCRNDYRAIKAIINSIKRSQTKKQRRRKMQQNFIKLCFRAKNN